MGIIKRQKQAYIEEVMKHHRSDSFIKIRNFEDVRNIKESEK